MHKHHRYLVFTAAAFAAAMAFSAPASATNLSQAQQLCRANPECTETKIKEGSGFAVKNGQGGTNEVFCPKSGECVCMSCPPPPTRTLAGGKGIRPEVGDVLPNSPGLRR